MLKAYWLYLQGSLLMVLICGAKISNQVKACIRQVPSNMYYLSSLYSNTLEKVLIVLIGLLTIKVKFGEIQTISFFSGDSQVTWTSKESFDYWIYYSNFIWIKYLLYTQYRWDHLTGIGFAPHQWATETDDPIYQTSKSISSNHFVWLWRQLGRQGYNKGKRNHSARKVWNEEGLLSIIGPTFTAKCFSNRVHLMQENSLK